MLFQVVRLSIRILFRRALAVISVLSLAGCGTTSLTSDIPNAPRIAPGSNVPVNYRQVIAEYMRKEFFRGLGGIHNAEIAGPYRHWGGLSAGGRDVDTFCVRMNGSYITTSFYWFLDGKMGWDNGGGVGSQGILGGAISYQMVCGPDPKFVPFPEAEYTPQR
jgi:hypothetical protein